MCCIGFLQSPTPTRRHQRRGFDQRFALLFLAWKRRLRPCVLDSVLFGRTLGRLVDRYAHRLCRLHLSEGYATGSVLGWHT